MDALDPNLAECYRRLNESFYSSSPASYFEQRLNCLLVVAADDPEYGQQLRSGITIAGQSIIVGPDERVDTQMDSEQLRRFITSETQVLLHHATESLLRLYLGHEGGSPCPWLDIATLISFSKFHNAVNTRFVKPMREETLRALVADTILGNKTYDEKIRMNQATWEEAVKRLTTWMCFFSRKLTKDAPIYNAAKHGFALCSDETQFAFMDEDGKTCMSHRGPSLEVLVHGEWKDDDRSWSLRTVWTSPIESWFFCLVAISIMDSFSK